jgi:hypothetical protein
MIQNLERLSSTQTTLYLFVFRKHFVQLVRYYGSSCEYVTNDYPHPTVCNTQYCYRATLFFFLSSLSSKRKCTSPALIQVKLEPKQQAPTTSILPTESSLRFYRECPPGVRKLIKRRMIATDSSWRGACSR